VIEKIFGKQNKRESALTAAVHPSREDR